MSVTVANHLRPDLTRGTFAGCQGHIFLVIYRPDVRNLVLGVKYMRRSQRWTRTANYDLAVVGPVITDLNPEWMDKVREAHGIVPPPAENGQRRSSK